MSSIEQRNMLTEGNFFAFFYRLLLRDEMQTKIAMFLFLVAGTVTSASNENSAPSQPSVKRVRRSSPSPPLLASTASDTIEIEPDEVKEVNPDSPDGVKGKLLKLTLQV